MTVMLALLAAVVYGFAVALQHHEAAASNPDHSLRPRLLFGLLVRPLWLLGLAGDIGGFALQTAALSIGSLILVQPILTLSLVVSLLLGARLGRRRLQPWEWLAVAGALASLSVFLRVAQPTEHSDAVATTHSWLIMVIAVAGVATAALAVGRTVAGAHRAMLFAFAAACAEAVMAVFAKAFGDRLGRGAWSTFSSWEPYAVVVCGVVTLLLVQSAYQVDRATATLPVLTVTEPIVAMSIGSALFGEHVHVGGWRAPVVVAALAGMVASLLLIATRSSGPDAGTAGGAELTPAGADGLDGHRSDREA